VLPERLRPGSTWNALALDAALGGAPAVQLAAPGLGSCVPLTLPGSLLVADFCANGVHSPGAGMHARLRERVAGFGGIDPAALRQFADPQFFEQLHAAIRARALPMLWRSGALVSD